jgi:CubicO group peptidase (beta-lactamase class C family)
MPFTEVLADGWMSDSTSPSSAYAEYGYQWWLGPADVFGAYEVFGQRIYINPKEEIVIAQHSAWANADRDSDWVMQDALFDAFVEALRD